MSEVFMPGKPRATKGLWAACAMLGTVLLSACSVFDSDPPPAPPPPPYMPVEFAMPANTSIDRGDTTVVGGNMNWYGTLALTSDTEMDDAHQFYAQELPREGWEPISTLVSDRVILQFVNRHRGRAAIVTIGSRTAVGGSHIEITVSPLVGSREELSEAEYPKRRPDR